MGSSPVSSQSPSLRGSGRFTPHSPHGGGAKGGLNPLHCGAVVASRRFVAHCRPWPLVSIPFIAGQWSLREMEVIVVSAVLVSIPFIAGQWSLPHWDGSPFGLTAFQSPSLRGSGRFAGSGTGAEGGCGVSIPFIAGQWSLRGARTALRGVRRVSIPFIAGQWSLPVVWYVGEGRGGACFNPLHCGAVVASPCRRQGGGASPGFNPLHCGAVVASRMAEGQGGPRWSFNPLHCGAVVASMPPAPEARAGGLVSIPFIAGQWSLLAQRVDERTLVGALFQSPSLRGSGRF